MTLWQLDFGGGLYLQNALGASLELPAYALMKARRRSAPARPALAPPTPGPRPALAPPLPTPLLPRLSPPQVLADHLGRRACWASFLCTITRP